VREMGQSAWLSTSFLTLQCSEGRVNAMGTECWLQRLAASRLSKNFCGTMKSHWPACLDQQDAASQDAQKVRPARPQAS